MGTGQHSLRQTAQSKKQLPVLEHREEKSLDVLWASSYRLLVMFIHKLSFFFGGTYLGDLHTAQAWQVHAKQTGKGMWLPMMHVDVLHIVTSSEQKSSSTTYTAPDLTPMKILLAFPELF